MPEPVYQFAESLRGLLAARDAAELDARWNALDPARVGWEALRPALRRDAPAWEAALDEVDGLLLRLLDRIPRLLLAHEPAAHHFRTFRLPELERLQHATAAALVGQRYGPAGLRTVLGDVTAPVARRYFAFLALAERHPRNAWPLFARYLTPDAHHAFLGTAAEAARFYPETSPAPSLVQLFDAVRDDLQLRAFLGPRILESLYVLADPVTTGFFRELLVAGYTDRDPAHCEVTHALVMVRRFTGRLEPNTKFPDLNADRMRAALAHAEAIFERRRDELEPVVVI
jgi:hypothetical protein